jgi:hypothetical protein
MPEPTITAVRLAGEHFLRPSMMTDLKALVVRLLLRKPPSEIIGLVLDPTAKFVSSLGTMEGPRFKALIEGSRATHVMTAREDHVVNLIDALPGILRETASLSRYVMLAPHRTPPPVKRKPGRYVHSMICDPQTYTVLHERAHRRPKSIPFYAALHAIETLDSEFTLLARHLPFKDLPAPRAPSGKSLRVIIPHRGDLAHLRNCLRRTLLAVRGIDARIHVALDEDKRDEHDALAHDFPTIRFWRVEPNGGGPYVPRHLLGTTAPESYVAFQDSDDVPTRDRFARLLADAETERADVVGSHVIDLHEDRFRAKAMRYPIDAVTPIDMKPQNTVFHPTSIVNSLALRSAGGFSTVRRFASDREFNLRTYFLGQKLRNIDEFLYVRRMRADSLIHSPETGMKSLARKQLHEIWHADWIRILNNELTLEESSLRATHLESMPRLVPVGAPERVAREV